MEHQEQGQTHYQNGKKMLTVVVLITTAAVLLLIGLIAVPLTKKIYSIKIELGKSQLTLEELRSDLAQWKKYRELKDDIGNSKELLEQAVIREATIVRFIESLEQLARETDNTITIEQYEPPKKKRPTSSSELEGDDAKAKSNTQASKTPAAKEPAEPAVPSTFFQLILHGNYRQMLAFISRLESMGYLIKINSLETKSINIQQKVSLKEIEEIQETEQQANVETRLIISFSLQK